MTDSIIFKNPSVISLPYEDEKVTNYLKYRDKSVEYQIFKLRSQQKWKGASGWVDARIDELKKEVVKSAVWHDEDGLPVTYSGLSQDLSQFFKWKIDNTLELPETKLLPWNKKPEFEMWPHQRDALEACLKTNHGGIECPTGSGKSALIIQLVKHFGLQTVVVTPSTAICNQLHKEFTERFGRKYVGQYGDGKKEFKKLITVCVAQALTRLEVSSDAYKKLSQSKVLLMDETHTVPADTFEKVCMGVVRDCPYRYFFSATHTRSDGSAIVLKGITGPILYSKPFKELVDEQILARPIWKMFVTNQTQSQSSDASTETRQNLYKNPHVNSLAAEIANKAVSVAGRPTVILIQEFSQFAKLYPLITVPFVFAHGGFPKKHSNKDVEADLSAIPEVYKNTDSEDAIKKFNSGEVNLLIGTSAVSVGVDLKPTQCLIYLQGGTSEVKVKQAIGRGTRMGVPGKKDFWVVDFLVNGSRILTKHALIRKKMYEDLIDQVDVVGEFVEF